MSLSPWDETGSNGFKIKASWVDEERRECVCSRQLIEQGDFDWTWFVSKMEYELHWLE